MRVLRILAYTALASNLSEAATLEHLTLSEMVSQSTAIVRAKAGTSRTVQSGSLLYTVTKLEVLEQWKGRPLEQVEVSLPGGALENLRQHFVGVPQLQQGNSYVIFLWQGPSGRIHVTGLSQGLLQVERNGDEMMVVRDSLPGAALSAAGQPINISKISMPLRQLRTLVKSNVQERR